MGLTGKPEPNALSAATHVKSCVAPRQFGIIGDALILGTRNRPATNRGVGAIAS